jgi:hypothetical protein
MSKAEEDQGHAVEHSRDAEAFFSGSETEALPVPVKLHTQRIDPIQTNTAPPFKLTSCRCHTFSATIGKRGGLYANATLRDCYLFSLWRQLIHDR